MIPIDCAVNQIKADPMQVARLVGIERGHLDKNHLNASWGQMLHRRIFEEKNDGTLGVTSASTFNSRQDYLTFIAATLVDPSNTKVIEDMQRAAKEMAPKERVASSMRRVLFGSVRNGEIRGIVGSGPMEPLVTDRSATVFVPDPSAMLGLRVITSYGDFERGNVRLADVDLVREMIDMPSYHRMSQLEKAHVATMCDPVVGDMNAKAVRANDRRADAYGVAVNEPILVLNGGAGHSGIQACLREDLSTSKFSDNFGVFGIGCALRPNGNVNNAVKAIESDIEKIVQNDRAVTKRTVAPSPRASRNDLDMASQRRERALRRDKAIAARHKGRGHTEQELVDDPDWAKMEPPDQWLTLAMRDPNLAHCRFDVPTNAQAKDGIIAVVSLVDSKCKTPEEGVQVLAQFGRYGENRDVDDSKCLKFGRNIGKLSGLIGPSVSANERGLAADLYGHADLVWSLDSTFEWDEQGAGRPVDRFVPNAANVDVGPSDKGTKVAPSRKGPVGIDGPGPF